MHSCPLDSSPMRQCRSPSPHEGCCPPRPSLAHASARPAFAARDSACRRGGGGGGGEPLPLPMVPSGSSTGKPARASWCACVCVSARRAPGCGLAAGGRRPRKTRPSSPARPHTQHEGRSSATKCRSFSGTNRWASFCVTVSGCVGDRGRAEERPSSDNVNSAASPPPGCGCRTLSSPSARPSDATVGGMAMAASDWLAVALPSAARDGASSAGCASGAAPSRRRNRDEQARRWDERCRRLGVLSPACRLGVDGTACETVRLPAAD
mmetsp:Transcript_19928/g.63365  ORF Transcript_19928/g.63365 Transcript_19928/m.63365 type:complete len:266 (-) Transcript_19928:406-1203(-)